MSKTRFNSVTEFLRHVSDDEEFNVGFDEHLRERDVVKTLFAMRTAKRISQSDVANRLGVTQSRISKIENGTDGDLRIRELEAYAQALGCDVHLVFMKRNLTAVDRVKYHAFCIKRELDRLADAARKDGGIARGVASFFGEAFVNLIRMIQNASSRLPQAADDSPRIRIGVAIECEESDEELMVTTQDVADPVP